MEELPSSELVEEAGEPIIETAGESAARMQRDQASESLSRKIADLKKQKKTNAANTGLSESMAAKINAEIDKNIDELARKRDESEGIVTSAAPAESMTSDAPKAAREPLAPRKAGETARTYEEHREDLEKAFASIEKAAEPQEVEVDLSDLNADIEKSKAEADKKTEDEFFGRGEALDQGHKMGLEQSRRSAAERRGDAGEERFAMAERAETLRRQMPAMQEQMNRAERLLQGMGVKDVDEAMMKRASGGFMEKAKGFFGGMFSKKTREMNHAMELYAAIRDDYTDRQTELNELDNRLQRGDEFRRAMQIKGERRGPSNR